MEGLAQRIAALAPHFTFAKPPGVGPFKTLIQLHGCGGRKQLMDRWAAVANAHGWAALIVDSYAHRRITPMAAYATVCTGLRLQGRERAGDLFAAMAWARAHPAIDARHIAVAGWSHGGWTVLDALALRSDGETARATRLADLPAEPLEGLAGAFICYPYAGRASLAGRRPWRIMPPTTAIVCGQDTIVGYAAPLAALQRLKIGGAPIEIQSFDSATHAFDEADAIDFRVRYDPAHTKRAHGLLGELLARI